MRYVRMLTCYVCHILRFGGKPCVVGRDKPDFRYVLSADEWCTTLKPIQMDLEFEIAWRESAENIQYQTQYIIWENPTIESRVRCTACRYFYHVTDMHVHRCVQSKTLESGEHQPIQWLCTECLQTYLEYIPNGAPLSCTTCGKAAIFSCYEWQDGEIVEFRHEKLFFGNFDFATVTSPSLDRISGDTKFPEVQHIIQDPLDDVDGDVSPPSIHNQLWWHTHEALTKYRAMESRDSYLPVESLLQQDYIKRLWTIRRPAIESDRRPLAQFVYKWETVATDQMYLHPCNKANYRSYPILNYLIKGGRMPKRDADLFEWLWTEVQKHWCPILAKLDEQEPPSNDSSSSPKPPPPPPPPASEEPPGGGPPENPSDPAPPSSGSGSGDKSPEKVNQDMQTDCCVTMGMNAPTSGIEIPHPNLRPIEGQEDCRGAVMEEGDMSGIVPLTIILSTSQTKEPSRRTGSCKVPLVSRNIESDDETPPRRPCTRAHPYADKPPGYQEALEPTRRPTPPRADAPPSMRSSAISSADNSQDIIVLPKTWSGQPEKPRSTSNIDSKSKIYDMLTKPQKGGGEFIPIGQDKYKFVPPQRKEKETKPTWDPESSPVGDFIPEKWDPYKYVPQKYPDNMDECSFSTTTVLIRQMPKVSTMNGTGSMNGPRIRTLHLKETLKARDALSADMSLKRKRTPSSALNIGWIVRGYYKE